MTRTIFVYGDWQGLSVASPLGTLRATKRGGGSELFEFELDSAALQTPILTGVSLDPRLGSYAGRQYPPQGRGGFGLFSDASPDRWGRLLVRRRHEREQRAGKVAAW